MRTVCIEADLVAASSPRTPNGTTLEITGPGGRRYPDDGPACDGRPAQRGQRARRRRRRARGRPGPGRHRSAPSGPFTGVGRRLERKGEAAGVVVYDDYAHHPTAIRETLRAIRQREPERRVWAVYEPLTYHRTAALLDRLRRSRSPTRMPSRSRTSGPDAIRTRPSPRPGPRGRHLEPRHDRIRWRRPGASRRPRPGWPHEVRPGDAVLVMGGGRSYRIGELLLEALAAEEASMTIDYAAGGELLEAYGRAWSCLRRRCLGRPLHRGCRVPWGPVRCTARRSQRPAGLPAGGGRAPAGRGVHGRASLGLGIDGAGRMARLVGRSHRWGRDSDRRVPVRGRRAGRPDRAVPRDVRAGAGDGRVGERRIHGWRCVIRRRQRLR